MNPFFHLILGGIFSLILYFSGVSLEFSLVIFVSSFFLIDLDHIFLFVLEKKSINPIKFWDHSSQIREKWLSMPESKKKLYKYPIFLFHNVEFLLILSLLSFFSSLFFMVFVGCFFHLIVDYIDLFLRKEPLYPKFSFLLTLKRNKNKKKLVL